MVERRQKYSETELEEGRRPAVPVGMSKEEEGEEGEEEAEVEGKGEDEPNGAPYPTVELGAPWECGCL